MEGAHSTQISIDSAEKELTHSTKVAPETSKSNSLKQNIRNFINNTKLSDNINNSEKLTMYDSKPATEQPLEDLDDLNEFNLNIPVNEDPGDQQGEEEVRNYHKNVKYLPNKNFNDSLPNSIPNTFKYKSFPNAKTKHTLGTGHDSTKLEISKQLDQLIEHQQDDHSDEENMEGDVSQRQHQSPEGQDKTSDKTPDWMPSELNERWLESNPSNSNLNSLSMRPSINFQLPSSNNSIIHNFRSKQTPDWKKVKQNYDEQKKVNLQQVFLDKSDVNNIHSLSSTLSTPYNSLRPNQLNKDQLKHLTEQAQEPMSTNKNVVYEIENVSPLKLFGPDYNTFTKGKLNELLCNLKAPPPPFNLNDLQKGKIIEEEENPAAKDASSELPQDNDLDAESEKGEGLMGSVNHKPLTDIQEVPEDFKTVDQDSYTFSSTEDKENSSFSGNPMPKLKTKTFDNDLESKFKMKANNIFDNIQKRGNFLKTSNNFSNSINGTAIATATSTPKVSKVHDVALGDYRSSENLKNSHSNHTNNSQAYSSFTSGFNQEDTTQFQELDKEEANTNEYTSFSSSNISSSVENEQALEDDKDNSNQLSDSYTYEHITDDNSVSSGMLAAQKEPQSFSHTMTDNANGNSNDTFSNTITSSRTEGNEKQMELEERIKFLEKQLGSVDILKNNINQLLEENKNLKEIVSHREATDVFDETQLTNDDLNAFRMKRISQLRLQQQRGSPSSRAPQHLKPPGKTLQQPTPSKGHLSPSNLELPSSYENMVLDEVNHRWIIKNDNANELDNIESLADDSDAGADEDEMDELVKKEVSFQLPHTDQVKSSPMNDHSHSHSEMSSDISDNQGMNITKVSEISEMSFSEHQKNLVSIITDALSITEQDWNLVEQISFGNYGINNVKDLQLFLPNLKTVDLSNNKIKYLNGLPKSTISLNLETNQVNNMSNFQKLLNLQKLNLFDNMLTNCQNLRSNIHLTRLNLSKNQIRDLSGLNNLTNLISLDLSNNKLTGTIDFDKFQFDNLQDLNMSENSIEVVNNMQKLPNLRILNLNENSLRSLNCSIVHPTLKKLLVKVNNLKQVELYHYPYLRVLRVDGNLPNIKLNGVETLKYLEEVSIKCFNTKELVKLNERNLQSVRILDISGNKSIFKVLRNHDQFINLNKLNMVSIDIAELPQGFNEIFPNLIEINFNFNKLSTLDQLHHYKNLKKVSVISNKLTKIETVIMNLKNSRKSIKFLDLRLNFINQHFYPYLFNPNETNIPIELEELDDIENFNILYNSLLNQDFNDMNSNYDMNLTTSQMTMKQHYLTLLVNFFPNLRKLDGCLIDNDTKVRYSRMISN